MVKYKYIGTEDKVYTDCTNRRFNLSTGTVFEPKCKPMWKDIEEVKKETKKNDRSK